MQFGWDERKHRKNLRERGFGFDFAAQIFADRTIMTVDDRFDYGELRVRAIGEADGVILVVVFNDRRDEHGEPLRWIISARPANRKERRQWHG